MAVAVRAARRAAAVIVDAARDLKRLPAHARNHAEIASGADTEAENAIIATLRAAFPNHAILGEEAGEIVRQLEGRGAGGPTSLKWLVDPIDGTANFVHGFPYYAVSIALMHGGDVTHAVVLDPVRDELYTAIKGKGAQLNGTPIRPSACVRLDEALVGTVFPSPSNPKMAAYLPVFNRLVTQCAGIRRAGSCALDLAYVASGRLDGFWVMSVKAWDVAAGALIVNEAGGRVGDFAGGAEFLRADEVLAAGTGVFNALREAVTTTRR
jgi:myo-inositol-1(or 4)-monophosphatase